MHRIQLLPIIITAAIILVFGSRTWISIFGLWAFLTAIIIAVMLAVLTWLSVQE